MGVVLAEQFHEAAVLVGAAEEDSSGLREYGIEEESIAEFVRGTAFGRPELGPIHLDPLSLVMGLTIGVVAARLAEREPVDPRLTSHPHPGYERGPDGRPRLKGEEG